jgi:hypothetical protein
MPVKIYNDFSGGEYGDLPPHQVPSNMWTGLNMMVYRSGELGPRPGIKYIGDFIEAESIHGAGFMGSPQSSHWVAANYAPSFSAPIEPIIKFFNLVSGDWDGTRDGNVPIATPDFLGNALGVEVDPEETYILNATRFLARYQNNSGGVPNTALVTSLTGTVAPGHAMTKYQERLYVSSGNRVYYSAPGTPFTFAPTTDWFDVGHGPEVRWMGWQRDSLLIITQDSAIWEYRGVPGRDNLRRVYGGTRHPWHFQAGRAILTPSDQLVFIPVDRDYPAFYSSGQITELKHLKVLGGLQSNNPSDVVMAVLDEDDELMIRFSQPHPTTGLERATVLKNGAWCFFEFDPDPDNVLFPGTPEMAPYISSDRQRRMHMYFRTQIVGGASALTTIWRWETAAYDMELDRPGFVSDTLASPGDADTTPLNAFFKLPESWTEDGNELVIDRIVVDFRKWNTGATETNHFDVSVLPLSRNNTGEAAAKTYVPFDEPTSSGSTTGRRDRHVAFPTDASRAPSAGFQVQLTNIRGCSIQQIRVEYTEIGRTPRG